MPTIPFYLVHNKEFLSNYSQTLMSDPNKTYEIAMPKSYGIIKAGLFPETNIDDVIPIPDKHIEQYVTLKYVKKDNVNNINFVKLDDVAKSVDERLLRVSWNCVKDLYDIMKNGKMIPIHYHFIHNTNNDKLKSVIKSDNDIKSLFLIGLYSESNRIDEYLMNRIYLHFDDNILNDEYNYALQRWRLINLTYDHLVSILNHMIFFNRYIIHRYIYDYFPEIAKQEHIGNDVFCIFIKDKYGETYYISTGEYIGIVFDKETGKNWYTKLIAVRLNNQNPKGYHCFPALYSSLLKKYRHSGKYEPGLFQNIQIHDMQIPTDMTRDDFIKIHESYKVGKKGKLVNDQLYYDPENYQLLKNTNYKFNDKKLRIKK